MQTRALVEALRKLPPNGLRESRQELVDEALNPANQIEIGRLLTDLFALTKRRAEDGITLDITLAAYGERLLEYPADVTRYVLTTWPDQSIWFPAWHELKENLEFWTGDRRAKMEALLNG